MAHIHKHGNFIKGVFNSCVISKIKKKKTPFQLMGKLPLYRVSLTLQFQNLDIDLVGPFTVDVIANIKLKLNLDTHVSLRCLKGPTY